MSDFKIIRNLLSTFTSGITYRFDCPFCRGKNTLAVTRLKSQYKWHCFKAQCHKSGVQSEDMSIESIREVYTSLKKDLEFILPERFQTLVWNKDACDWVYEFNVGPAWENNAVTLYFDYPEERVVFTITDRKGKVVGAIGRTLNKGIRPKWHKYGKDNYPFVCRSTETFVIVEDATSACAVWPSYTGIALLGTDINLACIQELKQAKRVVIALDPDAKKKALELRQKLAYIMDKVEVCFIPNDLKYFKQKDILEIIK